MKRRVNGRRHEAFKKRKGESIMKRLGTTIVLVGVPIIGISLIVALAQSQANPKPKAITVAGRPLPDCPVGGQPISFAVQTSSENGPVFFCCPNCIKKFNAEPKKFVDKVTDQRKALAQFPRTQIICPFSGEAVKSTIFIEDKGSKVYFCCQNCRGKYEKDPAKYAANLANSYTYQNNCPVTGKPIAPQISATAPAGETVFFCSKDCPDKFHKDPRQFAPKLEEQGFRLDLTKKAP